MDTQEELLQSGMLHIRVAVFEGPMDVLLDMIRRHQIDIFDIPIALITSEFLDHLKARKEMDLAVGGEWVEMAAMLIHIKSKLLVPPTSVDDEIEGPDPREELVQRLLEYQRYREAARRLDERPILGREVFQHPSRASVFQELLGPARLNPASISDLVGALERVIRKSQDEGTWVYEVSSQRLSLRSVVVQIAEILRTRPRITFDQLFEGEELHRNRVVTTFLALLEMTRLKMVKLFQSRLDGLQELYIERAVVDIVEISQTLELGE